MGFEGVRTAGSLRSCGLGREKKEEGGTHKCNGGHDLKNLTGSKMKGQRMVNLEGAENEIGGVLEIVLCARSEMLTERYADVCQVFI